MKTRALILGIMLLALAGCLTKQIQTGLTEREAEEIIVLLKENGLEAVKSPAPPTADQKEGSWSVSVKGGDQNLVMAWRILQENGLPRSKDRGLEQVFANSGMIPTASEEKARLLAGLAGEISRTLKSIDGVVDARVHVVLPENSPLVERSQWSPTTASVLLKYRGSQPPLREADIKNLVARGVEGLQPDNVAVVLNHIVPKQAPSRDLWWYAGNQQLLVSALALLALLSVGSLALVWRGRRQRAIIEQLRRELRPAPAPSAAAGVESVGRR